LELSLLVDQFLDGAAVILRLLLLALAQCLQNPVQQCIGEQKLTEEVLKLSLQLILPHIEPDAASLVEGAVVVNIVVFLAFYDYATAAGGVSQKTGVGEAVTFSACIVPLVGDKLGVIKLHLVDERRVLSRVALTVPQEVSRVEGAFKSWPPSCDSREGLCRW
jgi:hypothetical protein